MGTIRPHVRNILIHCAPGNAPGPTCGKLGRRKQVLHRQVRSIAYHTIVLLDITYAEYRARGRWCATFRTHPSGVESQALYDTKVRPAVLDRIRDDGRSLEPVIGSRRRDSFRDLSDGLVSDCRRPEVQRLELAELRRWVLGRFSGTLCVDEPHLGRSTLLLATDPLQELPVAFALVARNDQGPMRRFRANRKTWGMVPEVVVTDGANLYPLILAELWPLVRHQLCVFHVLKDLHKHVLEAVRRLRRVLARRGNRGRQRKPGRRPQSRAKPGGPNLEEKSAFIFQHRWLIVKRRDRMSQQERTDLATMLGYLPELKGLRDLVGRLGMLFEEGPSESWAWGRHAALTASRAVRAVPELAAALAMLQAEKCAKMIAFLKSRACRRVRTNNHVERVNRTIRHQEKARYQRRRRRTIVRLVVLLRDRYWSREEAIRSRWQDEPQSSEPSRSISRPNPRRQVA